MSSTDARVRDNFVGLIAKFAHGPEQSKQKNASNAFGGLFPKSADQFLKIGESLTIDKDFRCVPFYIIIVNFISFWYWKSKKATVGESLES